MFRREHHRDIALVLTSLDSDLFRQHQCYFGGGTAIVLLHAEYGEYREYRESVDMDFMVSDADAFREVRAIAKNGFSHLLRSADMPISTLREPRIDQYGIRAQLGVGKSVIKFEIVREARIVFDTPGPEDSVCGVSTLTTLDLVSSKLLANSDRWADAGIFSRDLIDLAMMSPSAGLLNEALVKSRAAYGDSVVRDFYQAVERLKNNPVILDRCIAAMSMEMPRAVLWQKIRELARRFPAET